jgi:hypothetical protein
VASFWSNNTMPTFVHGKRTVIKLDNSGGALQDLSAYFNSTSLQRLQDLLETTCFGATAKTYIAGFPDAKIPIGGFWDATVDAHLAGILGVETSSVELYPEGTATGKVKYTCEAILISYEFTAGSNQASAWTGELQVTGAVTRALVP